MQPRLFAAALIFIGSYLPLSLILLSQDFKYELFDRRFCFDWEKFGAGCEIPFNNPGPSIAFVGICTVCFLITLFALKLVKPRHVIEIVEAKHVPTDLMNYVLPYVVSFMSLTFEDHSKIAGFVIFLIWIFWIGHASGRIIFNPVLIVMGWKLHEIKYTFAASDKVFIGFCLSKAPLSPKSRYHHNTFQDVLIIKSDGGGE